MKKKNYLKKIIMRSAPLMAVYIIVYAVYAYMGVYFSELLGDAIDIVSKGMGVFWSFAILLLSVMAVMLMVYLIYTTIKNIIRKQLFKRVRKELFQQIIQKKIAEFGMQERDTYISALVNDVRMIEEEYLEKIFSLFEEVCTLVIAMIVLCAMDWMSALFVFVVSFIPVIVPVFFMQGLQGRMGSYAEQNQMFLRTVSDCMDGMETYKNYNLLDQIKEYFEGGNKALIKTRKTAVLYQDLLIAALSVASNLVMVGILCMGMFMALAGKMTVGEVFALMFISGNVIAPIASISQNLPGMLGVRGIASKYNAYFGESAAAAKALFDKTIVMENVQLEFGEREVLKEINLRIERGKKYAFVGGSGSGKSTILKTMLGYFSQYKGKIFYDGIDLSKTDPMSVFENITYVPQKTDVYTGTVRENITMFSDCYTDAEIREAVRKAQLEKKVASLPQGIDTYIEEGGKNFSGGERQRLAIARAILRGKNIFFMDEATSALDHDTYLLVERMLLEIPKATLVTVTHRIDPEILGRYDCVFVIKEGAVHAAGIWEQLYERDAYFMELYNAQKLR